ncbi:phospholipase A2 isozymes PA3A/PA3B/PA5-like [Thrips palmi]|uniref:phospholipase A2 n=1 Tax=Thrips palmi TaxID=161013 RepID=A0A6P8Y5C5_THRPL|nr:phospholipase A2 isozymes PA3A/PA3B/PA5-like [Thrips palmi]
MPLGLPPVHTTVVVVLVLVVDVLVAMCCRFRTCLKVAGNGPANLVGKLFFNVVQTKCFVLKPKKTCLKTSWWGKCIKWQVKKQAHLRDNTPY